MSKQTVFLVGATGETGSTILEALIEDGSFDITCFIRTESADKPAVQKLRERGLKVVTGDIAGPSEHLVTLLRGIDTVISSLVASALPQQIPLVDAAVKAGVKRFVPCNWATPAPRGILTLRDQKEEVHDHIFRHGLGYTIIDVGYWYQISFLRVPSGKFDYITLLPAREIRAGGTAPNMLIDKRDLGKITARTIKDERTLNKKVYVYGEVLSQNEIRAIIEEKTGETTDVYEKSSEELIEELEKARAAHKADPSNVMTFFGLSLAEYNVSKYVRADNTPEKAEYLGYINGRELYPDLKFISFSQFLDELAAGSLERPYPHLAQF